MKLKGREFPFWAVGKKTKNRATQKCYRFVRKGDRYDEFYYDHIVIISKWGGSWGETSWSTFSRKGNDHFSKLATRNERVKHLGIRGQRKIYS
jgi:hypothetical protein